MFLSCEDGCARLWIVAKVRNDCCCRVLREEKTAAVLERSARPSPQPCRAVAAFPCVGCGPFFLTCARSSPKLQRPAGRRVFPLEKNSNNWRAGPLKTKQLGTVRSSETEVLPPSFSPAGRGGCGPGSSQRAGPCEMKTGCCSSALGRKPSVCPPQSVVHSGPKILGRQP